MRRVLEDRSYSIVELEMLAYSAEQGWQRGRSSEDSMIKNKQSTNPRSADRGTGDKCVHSEGEAYQLTLHDSSIAQIERHDRFESNLLKAGACSERVLLKRIPTLAFPGCSSSYRTIYLLPNLAIPCPWLLASLERNIPKKPTRSALSTSSLRQSTRPAL